MGSGWGEKLDSGRGYSTCEISRQARMWISQGMITSSIGWHGGTMGEKVGQLGGGTQAIAQRPEGHREWSVAWLRTVASS